MCVALLALGCAGNPLDPSANTSDADGDGIQDNLDACPATPETVNGHQDTDGCPDSAPEPLPLAPEIAGEWRGASTAMVGDVAYTKPQTVMIQVSGDRLSGAVSGFCPDGTGSVPLSAHADAPDAAWRGVYSCSPGPWGTCADALPIRANMVVLSVTARASATGVSITTTGAVTFTDNDERTQRPCEQTGNFAALFTGAR